MQKAHGRFWRVLSRIGLGLNGVEASYFHSLLPSFFAISFIMQVRVLCNDCGHKCSVKCVLGFCLAFCKHLSDLKYVHGMRYDLLRCSVFMLVLG